MVYYTLSEEELIKFAKENNLKIHFGWQSKAGRQPKYINPKNIKKRD